MKLRLLFPVICFSALVACNNSSDNKEKKDNTTAMNHDGMHHPPVTEGVPPLPEVPEGSKVVFTNLKNNATISSPFKLQMGVEVMRIDTAGPVLAGSGHHHLIIDGPDSLTAGTVVPKDSVNIHFGKGETEYQLNLSPGTHKLTLQLADGLHRSYGGRLAATVVVNVK